MAAHDRQTFAAGYPESTAAVEITVRRDNDGGVSSRGIGAPGETGTAEHRTS
jgi:hypothetical protein